MFMYYLNYSNKNKMKKKLIVSLVMIFAGIFTFSMLTAFQGAKKPWNAPDKSAKMVNPRKADAASLKEGKELWVKHCQSCHGKTGHGDGPKAAQLKTEAGNFSSPATQKQTDGSLFYKILEGRDDMPSFKKKIPDADVFWSLVNYMRTLKS
jgi:mono/diheme cytochrome c family protein